MTDITITHYKNNQNGEAISESATPTLSTSYITVAVNLSAPATTGILAVYLVPSQGTQFMIDSQDMASVKDYFFSQVVVLGQADKIEVKFDNTDSLNWNLLIRGSN